MLEIDLARKRIALSMRLSDTSGRKRQAPAAPRDERKPSGGGQGKPRREPGRSDTTPAGNALADALAKAGVRR